MRILTERTAEDFLEHAGFPVIARALVTDVHHAAHAAHNLRYPVALKISSDSLLHKTEKSAVQLSVVPDNLIQSYHALDRLPIQKEGILVQHMIDGIPLLLGIKKDLSFGHVLTVAFGGIYTETLHDMSVRVLPITKHDAMQMLHELKGSALLDAQRGRPSLYPKIIPLLLQLSSFVQNHPTIRELDINPCIVNDKEARIVDARIIFDD